MPQQGSSQPQRDRSTALLAEAWEEPGNLESVQKQVVAAALEVFKADVCAIFSLNPITREFLPAPQIAGDLRHPGSGIEPPRHDGLAHRVLDQKELVVDDLAARPEMESDFLRREGIRAFAALALGPPSRLQPFAVLYIDFREPQVFNDEHRERLRHFGEQASSILQNTWLLNRYRKVIEIGQEINQELDTVENLFCRLDRHVSRIIDMSYFFMLATYSSPTESLDLYYKHRGRLGNAEGRPLSGGCRRVLEDRASLVYAEYSKQKDNLPSLEDIDVGDPEEPESLIFVPLLLRSVPLGVLSVQSLRPYAFDQEDRHILELLANHVATALSSIRLFEDLDRLNATGQLLTEQRDPDQVLERVVRRIQEATQADLVILHPYFQETGTFGPAHTAGDFLDRDRGRIEATRPGDIPHLAIALNGSRFLKDASFYPEHLSSQLDRPSAFQAREKIVSLAVVPLRVSGETVGTLFVNYRRPQGFYAPDRKVIEGLGVFAAIAIKNARLLGQLDVRHQQELEVLRGIDAALSRTFTLDQVLEAILVHANQVVRAENASILLMDKDKGNLQVASSIGTPPESNETLARRGQGITRWAYDHKTTVNVADVQTDPAWRDVYVQAIGGTRSELSAPLRDEDSVLGVINFESPRTGAFSDDDRRFVETLAGQVVLAIKKAQIYDTSERRARERTLLADLSQGIIRQLNLRELLEIILDRTIEATRAANGALMLYNEQRGILETRSERGTTPQYSHQLTLGQGVVGVAAREQKTLNIDPTDPQWRDLYIAYTEEMRSELVVPLLEEGRLRGVLNVESPEPNHFRDSEVRLVQALADMAVVALQNAERYEAAREGRQRLKALQTLSQEIVRQADDPDEVMKAIVAHALELTQATISDLDIYEGGRLVRSYSGKAAEAGASPSVKRIDLAGEDSPKLPRGIMRHVAATRRPYRTGGEATEDEYFVPDPEDPDIHSELAAPLIGENGELVGVLNVDSREPYAFDDTDEELLALFAAEAVIAIQNARSFEKAQRELARFETLLRAAHALGEIHKPDQRLRACEIVTTEASQHCGGLAVIRLYEPIPEELVLVQRSEPWGDKLPFERMKGTEGVNGYVFQTRRTVFLGDAANPKPGEPCPRLSDPHTRSLLITPIQLYDSYYGNLGLSHPDPNQFHEAEIALVEGLALLLAITFHRLEGFRRQQEFQERAKQAEVMGWMGDASYNLAHRLGNDLGLIRSYVNNAREAMTRQGFHDPVVEENLNEVIKDTSRVLKMSELLKQEVATFIIEEPRAIRVSELLEEMREKLRNCPPNISVLIDEGEDPGMLMAVPRQVTDILRNLVDNALEAMPEGGMLTICTRQDQRSIRFQVADTGVGISPDNLEKIFKFLYSTKGSSGFGLWSAQKKASFNNGKLEVESAPGKGATFTLTLPRADQQLEVEFAR